VLGLLAAVAGAAAIGAWLAGQSPTFWQQENAWLGQQGRASLEAMAVNLEQRALAALQAPGGRSELVIEAHQANAWLKVRLWPRIEHFWPEEAATWRQVFGQPVLAFADDTITLAFAQPSGGSTRIVTAEFRLEGPKNGQDGDVLRLARLSVGRLPLLGGVRLYVSAMGVDKGNGQAISDLLEGVHVDDALLEDAYWTAGRPVRLMDLVSRGGRLRVVFEAQAP